MTTLRSPLFYVGDKYKLMPQLNKLFPTNIKTFYDVFAGGGSASLNTPADNYVLNDLDNHIINLHEYLSKQLQNPDSFIKHEIKLINKFGLSHSAENVFPENIDQLKKMYKKTYFSKCNKNGYYKLRKAYNENQNRIDLFYLLLVFGFNHMTRFNNKGDFNLPVGNVDWNNNVEKALRTYSLFVRKNNYKFENKDFEQFINEQHFNKGDFLYIDPPYLISLSEYNKMWNANTDIRLFKILDKLNLQGINWGLSNLITHKGRTNSYLKQWIKNYTVYPIQSNYISSFDNTIKKNTHEVYVTNVNINNSKKVNNYGR